MSVLVVGAGVFGQVIAARLREDGHDVVVFDRREPLAGSPPSGGHLKPSWLTAIPRNDLDRSMETLERLYGMETLECEFLIKKVNIQRVDIDAVLNGGPVVEANVTEVGNGCLWYQGPNGERLCKQGTVIVAAGVWSAELLPQFKHYMEGKRGISWLFYGGEPVSNIIRPWAPYKQIVRTSHGPGRTWIGDGTAIKTENWTEKREQDIYDRVIPHAPKNYEKMTQQRGIRPYMTNGFQKVGEYLWLATGGAKSGMALAGVYANKLAETLS